MASTTNLSELRSAKDVLADLLKDAEFRTEWERLAPARAVANRVVGYRIDHGLTQTALARRLGVSQPMIARLEDGEHLPSIETLVRLAERLGMSFQVEIRPAETAKERVAPPGDGAPKIVERFTTQHGAEVLVAAG